MKKIVIALISTIFIVTSCGSINGLMDRDKLMKVKVGMTQTEIINLFGRPHYRTLMDGREEWKYRYETYSGNDFIQLIFNGNILESFDSYFLPDQQVNSILNTTSTLKTSGTNRISYS